MENRPNSNQSATDDLVRTCECDTDTVTQASQPTRSTSTVNSPEKMDLTKIENSQPVRVALTDSIPSGQSQVICQGQGSSTTANDTACASSTNAGSSDEGAPANVASIEQRSSTNAGSSDQGAPANVASIVQRSSTTQSLPGIQVEAAEPVAGPSNEGVFAQERAIRQWYHNYKDLFSHVIVFVPSTDLADGTCTSQRGKYKLYAIDIVTENSRLTDWTLEFGTYKNCWRTIVKPVYVREHGQEIETSLFARIRKYAPMPVVREIVHELNRHLDRYRDHLRRGIAEEWNAQEMWRIFPADETKPVVITFNANDRINVKPFMKELLPQGYDADWEM